MMTVSLRKAHVVAAISVLTAGEVPNNVPSVANGSWKMMAIDYSAYPMK